MSQQYPEIGPRPEAAEGDASHEIGAELIGAAAVGWPKRTAEEFIGRPASNGVIYNEALFEGAELYANDVAAIMRSRGIFGGVNLGIEHSVTARRIHELSFGTLDSFVFDRKALELFIWDYKFGYEVVEVFENWQLLNYMAGLFEQLGIDGLEDQALKVRFRVVQPRAFHRDGPIREWIVKASDLRGYFNQLHAAAHEALGPNAVCRTGSHCRHCTARHACPPALRMGLRLFELADRPIPVELSPAALGVQLAIIRRGREHLEYLESAFETQVKTRIRTGGIVPGWAAEEGIGREKWKRPVSEVVAMGDLLDQELRKPEATITPTQARKLGIDGAVITAYSEHPRTGLVIVPDNGNKTKQVFT